MGIFLSLVFIGVTLAVAIPDHQAELHYHMIDNDEYESFVWIRDNVDVSYKKAVLDPWKVTPFTAITWKQVYSRIHESESAKDREAQAFLKGGCKDTSFLVKNGISIVYTPEPCSNPDLVEVRKYVYLLK